MGDFMATRLRLVTGLAVTAAALFSGNALADIDASELYKLRCSACHGVNGEGTDSTLGFGPALKGNPLVMNAPAPALIQIIRHGRSGERRLYDKGYPNMPAFGFEVVPDVEALVAYLKGGLQK
jgi:mono/diheme cytochrome c family protein